MKTKERRREACRVNEKNRKIIFSAIVGAMVAFCYVAGYQLDNFDSLNLTDTHFYLQWAAATIGAGIIVYLIWQGLDFLSQSIGEKNSAGTSERYSWWTRLACTVFLFLCWLPVLLSVFPGVFSYDAFDEWEQVHNWMLTSHHPVAHVLILGGLVEGFFQLTGSYNAGIAVYSILQMLVLAGVFTATAEFMREFDVPRGWRVFSVVFYAFSPVVQLFSVCATKDVFFTGAELIFFLYVVRFSLDKNSLLQNRKRMVRFGLSALSTMIFRNNGVYIVLLTFLVLAMMSHKVWQKYKRNLLLFLLVVFVPYFLYTGPVYKILGVTPGGVEEMFSVPLQQMARVYRYDYDSLDQEDLQVLYSFVERDALEQYKPTVSDFVKRGFNRDAFENNKSGFFRLWAKWGIEHPLTYMNSFLINTVDAWYPPALIDGYRHGDGRGSWFDYRVAPPGEEKVYMKRLHDFYDTLSHDLQAQKKPLAFLVMSPGWYFLCAMVGFFYFWSRKKYRLMLPLLVFVFHIVTVFMGPMILVRYMLLFFFAFPVLGAMVIWGKKFEQREGTYGKIQNPDCGG